MCVHDTYIDRKHLFAWSNVNLKSMCIYLHISISTYIYIFIFYRSDRIEKVNSHTSIPNVRKYLFEFQKFIMRSIRHLRADKAYILSISLWLIIY